MININCKVWTMTVQIEENLRSSENNIIRTICGLFFDYVKNRWRKKNNAEIRELRKGSENLVV